MINAHCRTNMDGFIGASWPEKFAALPRIGDYVATEDSHFMLRVASITHKVRKDPNGRSGEKMPVIVVELNRM